MATLPSRVDEPGEDGYCLPRAPPVSAQQAHSGFFSSKEPRGRAEGAYAEPVAADNRPMPGIANDQLCAIMRRQHEESRRMARPQDQGPTDDGPRITSLGGDWGKPVQRSRSPSLDIFDDGGGAPSKCPTNRRSLSPQTARKITPEKAAPRKRPRGLDSSDEGEREYDEDDGRPAKRAKTAETCMALTMMPTAMDKWLRMPLPPPVPAPASAGTVTGQPRAEGGGGGELHRQTGGCEICDRADSTATGIVDDIINQCWAAKQSIKSICRQAYRKFVARDHVYGRTTVQLDDVYCHVGICMAGHPAVLSLQEILRNATLLNNLHASVSQGRTADGVELLDPATIKTIMMVQKQTAEMQKARQASMLTAASTAANLLAVRDRPVVTEIGGPLH